MVRGVERVQHDGMRRYTVVLIPSVEGGFVVEVPALPGCLTQGDTREEALANAAEAIAVHIAGMEADGEPVPVEADGSRPTTALVSV
jgi:predicted RNase H-like HicB family nuclease